MFWLKAAILQGDLLFHLAKAGTVFLFAVAELKPVCHSPDSVFHVSLMLPNVHAKALGLVKLNQLRWHSPYVNVNEVMRIDCRQIQETTTENRTGLITSMLSCMWNSFCQDRGGFNFFNCQKMSAEMRSIKVTFLAKNKFFWKHSWPLVSWNVNLDAFLLNSEYPIT